MSVPVKAEETPAEYGGRLTPAKRQFNGSYLISKEEWKETAKFDPYLLQIVDFIEQDRAYVAQVRHEMTVQMRVIKTLRARIVAARARVDARKRQYKYFEKQLRKRMAMEKIAKLRKEMGYE